MTERDILSDPILTDIYERLIDGCQYSGKPDTIKRQALSLIKKILLHKILVYYNVPQWFILTLASDETEQLRKYLKKKAERLGQTKSDEEIDQEIEHLNEYFDKVTQTQIAQEANNG